ncbi:hypothetical protein [Mesorhizobium sp. ZC-5]|uniref:hypothetical protein n=1 Tax=Mesorhizobium sp. ZC-5 TaxID=2986066 RepID=UPI0021E8A861|nr:hypothetical protein [Mesorhizobium sp. ZC-5]MCV3242307.1 hypothetical protein [Mesorhizobium sp. ZC-5]
MGVYWFAGLWGVAMVAVLISAIRLSYRIEARSEGLKNTSGVPRKAMWIHTILNWRVARDEETQALRRRMNLRFLIILVGFALFAVALWSAGAFQR